MLSFSQIQGRYLFSLHSPRDVPVRLACERVVTSTAVLRSLLDHYVIVSGTTPRRSMASISMISGMSIMSPRATIPLQPVDYELGLLKSRRLQEAWYAVRIPYGRNLGCSDYDARSAPEIALRNPCSIPAGRSTMTKSCSSFRPSMSSFICSGLTAFLSLV